ncbi:MAG: hypothetical protein A2W91_08735 [Bacteroidetes bacterium GWF2_38_335]|nr:MAG: hypothetical protein A2W91_08735 [Bacteroidetes bacterium GWF2_38_335]OFY80460.1 MAG: hypothetical protein A2281_08460 [Bacteroidetes bacterium RIFOXYA12_FULL_38_20]HBS85934.1 hypothetical protein [Bacteroidales bacterium]
MRNYLFTFIVLLLASFHSNAQYTITSGDGTTVFTSSGTVYLGAYSTGQIYTFTLCSDNPLSSHVGITFDAWTVGSGNYCVYDGNSTSAPFIGCNAWGVTQTVMASQSNTSGCITIMFSSTAAGSNIGGQIVTSFSCQSVLSSIIATDPPASFSDGTYYIDLCQGGELSIEGHGIYQNTTYTQSDATSNFHWTFGDGTSGDGQTISNVYADQGGYDINLKVTDQQGCESTNDIGYKIRVSMTPSFSYEAGTYLYPWAVCQGELIHLVGNVGSEEFVSFIEPLLMDTTHLPDGTGVSYSSYINYDCYSPGQILEDIEDLCGICAILEHSFLGDLSISITCPYNTFTGAPTTVILEYQHGGGSYLGQPIDDMGGGGPGIGWEYCWTIPEDADYMEDIGDAASSYSTLPSGNYLSSNPLDPLVGCQLNGLWTLTVDDNWSVDDGYIFGWWMCFDPELGPEQWGFQNTYPTTMWTPGGLGGEMVDPTTGIYLETGLASTYKPFIYTVVDDFGCAYDTVINVYVLGDTVSVCQGMYSMAINNGDVLEVCDLEFESGYYSPTDEYAVTFCSSDSANHYASLTFESFLVEEGTVCIYDGMSIAAPLIDCDNFDMGETFIASIGNVTGCLTLSFDPSIPNESFIVQVGCSIPCQEHDAAVASTTPSSVLESGYYYIDACQGYPVHFEGTGIYPSLTYPQSDESSTFVWNFGDGGTATGINTSHIYFTPGGYEVDLVVADTMNCPSNNSVKLRVRVSGPPDFSSVYADPVIACQTEVITLHPTIHSIEYVNYFEPYIVSDTFYLPDGSGESYESILFFDYFESGTTLQNINDLCGICAIMEHSFLGDLTIEITCPYNTLTGLPTTVVLEEQHGGGTYLGVPIDDMGGGGPGVGWEYCWTIPADADYLQDMGDYAGSVSTLPSGSYITSEPLDPLVGCTLNGGWTLTVTDNWSVDDGYIFSWWICFEEDLLPADWEFHNTYPLKYWAALVEGGEMLSDNTGTYSGFGDSTTVQPFLLFVTDDFGCNYDTTVYVTFLSDSIAPCNTLNIDETDFLSENKYGFYLKTYPNPIDDYISIEYHTDELLPVSIMLMDPLGKQVYQKLNKESLEVQKVTISEIEVLSPGTYYLVVKYKETEFVKKVIVF